MDYIIVINDISEDSLFGSEEPPTQYDVQQLQTILKDRLQAMYPGVNIDVWDSQQLTDVQVDGGDWRVHSQVLEVINQTWQKWLEQFE